MSGFINQFKEKYLFIVDFHMRCIVNYYFLGIHRKSRYLRGEKKDIKCELKFGCQKKILENLKTSCLLHSKDTVHKMLQIMSAFTIILSSSAAYFFFTLRIENMA